MLDVDLAAAGASDDLAHSIDYRSLAEAVVGAVESSSYLLIEALATRIADICLAVKARRRPSKSRLESPARYG